MTVFEEIKPENREYCNIFKANWRGVSLEDCNNAIRYYAGEMTETEFEEFKENNKEIIYLLFRTNTEIILEEKFVNYCKLFGIPAESFNTRNGVDEIIKEILDRTDAKKLIQKEAKQVVDFYKGHWAKEKASTVA